MLANGSNIFLNNSNTTIPYHKWQANEIVMFVLYALLFLVAVCGNVTVFLVLLRNARKTRVNRVYMLLQHLNVADLIVTFIHMPAKMADLYLYYW